MSNELNLTALTKVSRREDIIDLRMIFHVLKTYRLPIAGFTIAVVLLAFLKVVKMTPIYQASAVLLIEQEAAKVVSIEEVYGIVSDNDMYLNTQFEVLKSRSIMAKVVQELDLANDPEFNGLLATKKPGNAKKVNWRGILGRENPLNESQRERFIRNTVNTLLGHVSIVPVRKTQIAHIKVTSHNPEKAANIANAIAETYIESFMEAKHALTQSATSWMLSRLTELSKKVRKAELKLQNYREKEGLVDLEGVLTLSRNELMVMTKSLVDVRRKLAISENINHLLESGTLENAQDYESLQAVLKHPLIQQLKHEQAKLRRKVLDMSRRYGPKHPKMISARSELESNQQNIRDQISNIVEGVERDHQMDKANEKSLQEAVAASKKQVQTINRKQFRLRALEREVSTNKDLYDEFYKRIQETNATSDLESANARIVDPAFAPQNPIKPKKKMIVGIAGLLSLLVCGSIAFLLEVMNNTIRSPRDVEDKLSLPVLGVVQKLEDKTLEGRVQKLFLDKNQHSFSEAVRTIRTSIKLATINKEHCLFAVTSTVPGEGRSSIAANLALSLGPVGKTLLIDSDLCAPTIGKTFAIKDNLPGLGDLLKGTAKIADCIHQAEGINIIPCGLLPSNPQELLATNTFAKVIERLKQYYDYVVVDCPPEQNLSEILMNPQLCDGLLYVIEASRTPVGVIQNTVSRLIQAETPLIGVVLNKIDPKKDPYGYSQGYYDYDGDHSAHT